MRFLMILAFFGFIALNTSQAAIFTASAKAAWHVTQKAGEALGVLTPQKNRPFSHQFLDPTDHTWRTATFSSNESQHVREIMKDHVSQGHGSGVVIGVVDPEGGMQAFHYGNLSRKSGAPAMTGDTVFELGGLTNSYTSLLLVRLADEGILKLDDPVSKHLPAKVAKALPKGPHGEEITLRHLATHTSGLPAHVQLPWYRDANKLSNWDRLTQFTSSNVRSTLKHSQLNIPPGSTTSYSSLGYGLLGEALVHRYNQHMKLKGKHALNYEGLLQKYVTQPLGMQSTHVQPHSQTARVTGYNIQGKATAPLKNKGPFTGSRELTSSLQDQLRFMKASQGYSSDTAISQALKRSQHPTTNLGWRHLEDGFFSQGLTSGQESFMGFHQGYGVVVLSNGATSELKAADLGMQILYPEYARLKRQLKAVAQKLKDSPKEVRVKLKKDQLKSYTGLYQSSAGNFEVSLHRGKLYLQMDGQKKLTLESVQLPTLNNGEPFFFVPQKDAFVTFRPSSSNQMQLSFHQKRTPIVATR